MPKIFNLDLLLSAYGLLSVLFFCREATMQLVNEHCGEQLHKYTACVQANPNGWHNHCEEYRVQLGTCAQKQ